MVQIRDLVTDDVARAMELSRAEGWNQTARDWALLIGQRGNVSLAAEVEGQLVGTGTAFVYGDGCDGRARIAWIGMILVDRAFRGRGISKVVLAALFDRLGGVASIKLDATPAGRRVYETLGFRDEYVIYRMTAQKVRLETGTELDGLERMQASDLPEVVELDAKVFGASRAPLLAHLLERAPDSAWLIRRAGAVLAAVMGRAGSRFHHVGPVMAERTEDAIGLIGHVLRREKDRAVVVDVLQERRELIEWLERSGFVKQRDFTRMYKDLNPYPGDPARQQLICGPEFG